MKIDLEEVDEEFRRDFGKKKAPKVFSYDKELRMFYAGKKNAKIANVDKLINLSKVDIGWLDAKFKKHSVDFIIAHPPCMSKNTNEKALKKVYDEFFYQAEYFISKALTVTV